MLQDLELLTETTGLITQQHFSAAAALHQVAEHLAQMLILFSRALRQIAATTSTRAACEMYRS
jgi:phosphoenolpyruvate-protein kinase (PTS system EI component)